VQNQLMLMQVYTKHIMLNNIIVLKNGQKIAEYLIIPHA